MLRVIASIVWFCFFSFRACIGGSLPLADLTDERRIRHDHGKISTGPVKALILGDWGERLLPGQDQVAEGMAKWAEENSPDYIVTTGDNIYPSGITSPNDNQMERKWRRVYSQPSLADMTWYVGVGNHDFGDWEGREWNEVEFGKIEPRWVLPHLWYDVVDEREDFTVHWVIIDTESFVRAIVRNNYTDMMGWMENTLRQSTADWKIVVGHRHVFSAGDVLLHAGEEDVVHSATPVTESIFNVLVPIMQRNNATAYVCGHDHNLQHIRHVTDTGMDYVISGAGGALPSRYIASNEDYIRNVYQVEPLFFKMVFGFVTMDINKERILYEFWNKDAELQYSFARTK